MAFSIGLVELVTKMALYLLYMNERGLKSTGDDNNMIMDIEKINKELATKTPIEIVQWAITNVAQTPIVTTNFRPYEVGYFTSSYNGP